LLDLPNAHPQYVIPLAAETFIRVPIFVDDIGDVV